MLFKFDKDGNAILYDPVLEEKHPKIVDGMYKMLGKFIYPDSILKEQGDCIRKFVDGIYKFVYYTTFVLLLGLAKCALSVGKFVSIASAG